VTIIEWAEVVAGILPADRLTVTINNKADSEHARTVAVKAGGDKSAELIRSLA
jgi:tRNA A37 threonylcarbamoyladenosine biosynthesis protein TsaE